MNFQSNLSQRKKLEHDLAATRRRINELKGRKLDAFGRAALDTLVWREQRILKYLRRAS